MRRNLLILAAAVLVAVGGEARGQNRILDSGNQFFSITNFGPGPATLSNMTGLPLGTVPEASGTGELALKVMVVGTTSGGGGSGTQRTASVTTVSSSGTVAAGARKLTFVLSPDFTGTILTGTFSGATDAAIPFDAPAGDTVGAIPYTISAGSIRILKVQ